MPELNDHDKLLKMEVTCAMTRKALDDKLDGMIQTIEKEFTNYRDFLNNGITKKIAEQVNLQISDEFIEKLVNKVIQAKNQNRNQNSRKTDRWKDWNWFQKVSTAIGLLIGLVGASKALSFAFDLLAQFFEKISGLK